MKILLAYCFCVFTGLLVAGIEGKYTDDYTIQFAKIKNNFSHDLFYEFEKKYRGQSFNIAAGPILLNLAVFLEYSKGSTYRSLWDLFKTENTNDLKTTIRNGTNVLLDVDSGLSLKYESKIYADDDYKFCPDFKKTYAKYFRGETENADYDYPKQVAKEIYKEVNSKELGRYGDEDGDLVYPRIIKNSDGFTAVSSIRIVLNYDTGYNPNKVESMYFFNTKGKSRVLPALSGTGIIKYLSLKKYDAQFISISLKGGNFSRFIILPNQNDGLSIFLKKIRYINIREEIIANMKYQCVDLKLPLTKSNTEVDVTDVLKTIRNLDSVFDQKRPEISGVTDNCNSGAINGFFNKVKYADQMIEDNTFNGMKKTNRAEYICSGKKLIPIKIDRPFAYSILSNALAGRPAVMSGVYY